MAFLRNFKNIFERVIFKIINQYIIINQIHNKIILPIGENIVYKKQAGNTAERKTPLPLHFFYVHFLRWR